MGETVLHANHLNQARSEARTKSSIGNPGGMKIIGGSHKRVPMTDENGGVALIGNVNI